MAILTSDPGPMALAAVTATPGDWWLKDSSRLAYSVSFDGVNDYINIVDAGSYFDGDFTVESWFRLDEFGATGNDQLITCEAYPLRGWRLMHSVTMPGRVQFSSGELGGTATVLQDNAFVIGVWQHIGVTRAGDAFQLYVGGLPISGTGVDTGTLNQLLPTDDMTISLNTANGYKGEVKDFRIWNYARSADEILGFKGTMLKGNEPGLIGYWPMNEGSGILAYDLSAGAKHGVLTNGPTWTTDIPPVLGMPVNILVPALSTSETEVQNAYSALGRTNKIVVSDVIQGEEFELDMEFYGKEDFERFNIMRRGQRPLLLQAYNGEQWFIRLGADRNVDRQMSYDPSVYRVKVAAYQQPIPTS